MRGIAILLVFVAHMAVPGLPALGAVGVTVFFTLSGFLITGLLLEERERSGRIALRRFYERRVRRLMPAFLASTAAVAIFSPLGAWWFEWRDVPGVLLYYSNWAALGNGGLPSLGGLSGTWSLAIEEQFYVAWPLVLLLVVRAGRRSVLLLALTGAALSLAVRAYLLRSGATLDRIYLGTDTVAVSLLGGAALVAWQGMSPSRRRGGWLVLAGVVMILATTRLDPEVAVFFGIPVASFGTVLLLAGATSSRPPAALARPVLVWFGQRSYGLYLWHCPLGFLLREGTDWSWPAIVAVMLPTSLILAEGSYRYIEEPFRRRRPPQPAHSSGVIPATTVHDPSSSLTFSG